MSRTPKREIFKLPKWVQQELTKRDEEIDRLVLELEVLTNVVEQLEEVNEELAKRGEENAQAALAVSPIWQFQNRIVDL